MTEVYVGDNGKIAKIKYVVSKKGEDTFEFDSFNKLILAVEDFNPDGFSDWLDCMSDDSDRPKHEIREDLTGWIESHDVIALIEEAGYTYSEIII